MFLINSRQEIFRCGPHCWGQTLSRSYGRFFAEFLKGISLVRLSLLDSTTCVGLRYGTAMVNPNEVFLGSALLTLRETVVSRCDPSWTYVPDLPNTHPQSSNGNPIIRCEYSTPSLHRTIVVCRNINLLSIASPIRDLLRTD